MFPITLNLPAPPAAAVAEAQVARADVRRDVLAGVLGVGDLLLAGCW